MAQLNITFNQEEILRLMADQRGDAFKNLLQESLNVFLKAESTQQLKAEPYERNDERTDSRNGERQRKLVTRIGTLVLSVPRHRNIPFKTLILDKYKRSEGALITTMAEMVVAGVSTAKVGKVMKEICGKNFSKQTVSEACKELDKPVNDFINRKLSGKYLFVMADATYVKVRENHRVRSKAILIALGFTAEGYKEILGVSCCDSESKQNWLSFFTSLKERGLSGVKIFTSDAHEGIASALQSVYPDVAWQRCQVHFSRNIANLVPDQYKVGLKSELTDMFNSKTIEQARKKRDEIMADYSEISEKAMQCLDEGFDDAMTVMELPKSMRRPIRTTNLLERLNKEVKRRTNVIGVFPNVASSTRLIGALLMEQNDCWAIDSKLYYKNAIEDLKQKTETLIKIAHNQKQLREAA